MVQSILIFALGFLAAAFIALAVGPAVWRRAAELTRKRIEASLPLTLNELQADKDQLRAEFAIALNKSQSKAKALQDKISAQMADVGANRERSRLLMAERDALDAKAQALESDLGSTQKDLSDRMADIAVLKDAKASLEAQTAQMALDLELRDRTIVDLQIELDNRRLELAANATERQRLDGKVSEVTTVRKGLEQKLRDVAAEYRAAREAQRLLDRRANDAEKRSEKTVAQLADREERLKRRESELTAAKDELRRLNSLKTRFEQEAQSLERQRLTLEKQNAKMEERLQKLASMAVPGTADKSLKKLEEDKVRLMDMVERLTAEKNELVRRLKNASAEPKSDSMLRDQVQDLAAKVVALAADGEGARSPVTKLLKTANEDAADGSHSDDQDSLAGRIRAVQNAARRGS